MSDKIIELDNKKFKVSKWKVRKAVGIQSKLLPLLTSLPELLKYEETKEENLEAFKGLIENQLFQDEDKFWDLLVRIITYDVIDCDANNGKGARIDERMIDKLFREDLMLMYKLVFEILKFQFGNFLKKEQDGLMD